MPSIAKALLSCRPLILDPFKVCRTKVFVMLSFHPKVISTDEGREVECFSECVSGRTDPGC